MGILIYARYFVCVPSIINFNRTSRYSGARYFFGGNMKRTQAREQAFSILFSDCFGEQSAQELIENALAAQEYEEDEYSLLLIKGVKDSEKKLDEVISANLNAGWKIGRLPKTTLAILRIAIFEILFLEDVPDSVSVNEAVELAKKFGSENDYVFVNGLLGSVVRSK